MTSEVPTPALQPAVRSVPMLTRVGWGLGAGFGYLVLAILVSIPGFGHAGPGGGGMIAFVLGMPGTLAMFLFGGNLLLGLLGGIIQWALIGAFIIAPRSHRRACAAEVPRVSQVPALVPMTSETAASQAVVRPISTRARIGWGLGTGLGYLVPAILVSIPTFGVASSDGGVWIAFILGMPGTLVIYLFCGNMLFALLGGFIQWALIGAFHFAPSVQRRADAAEARNLPQDPGGATPPTMRD